MNEGEIKGTVTPRGQVRGSIGGGGITGNITLPNVVTSDDYLNLRNKPSINGHTLINDSDYEDIGFHFMTNVELQQLLGGNNNG